MTCAIDNRHLLDLMVKNNEKANKMKDDIESLISSVIENKRSIYDSIRIRCQNFGNL